jgi:hypothetical protein
MTATTPIALTGDLEPEERRRARRALFAVPFARRRTRPRAFYAIVAVGTLGVIVAAQLLLSIGVSQGAFRLEKLQTEQTTLARGYQAASEDVNNLSSPQNLAANAHALGMVNNTNPVYLRLSDGAVIGATGAGNAPSSTQNLIANSPLAGVPLTADKQTDISGNPISPSAPGTPGQGTPGSNDTGSGKAPVPLVGDLPAPTTH